MARQQARRQQRERVAGIVVVGMGIVVLLVAIAALREPKGHVSTASSKGSPSSVAKQNQTKRPSPSPSKSRTSASGTATHSSTGVKDVPLVVLNNSTIQGLAAEAAQRFEDGGWTVTESGNLTNTIVSSCAYYDESDPQAKYAAEALQAQYPAIKRVKPKFPELPSGPVVVVLTGDYTAA
jgi:hypothetical protein